MRCRISYSAPLMKGRTTRRRWQAASPGTTSPSSTQPLVATRLLPGRGRLYEVMRDGRFALLGTPAMDVGAWSQRVTLTGSTPTRGHVTLVRPDAYAAWSGSLANIAGLHSALLRWCGPPTPESAPRQPIEAWSFRRDGTR